MKIDLQKRKEITQNILHDKPTSSTPSIHNKKSASLQNLVPPPKPLSQLQKRARACTFFDPLINKSSPILCGTQNFVSLVRSRCMTRLGNQLSAYAAVRYFQEKYQMIPVMEPFQMKIIKSVFRADALTVRSLSLDTCCKDRKMVMALKADKRTGVATGLTEDFERNSENFQTYFKTLILLTNYRWNKATSL